MSAGEKPTKNLLSYRQSSCIYPEDNSNFQVASTVPIPLLNAFELLSFPETSRPGAKKVKSL